MAAAEQSSEPFFDEVTPYEQIGNELEEIMHVSTLVEDKLREHCCDEAWGADKMLIRRMSSREPEMNSPIGARS